MTKDERIEEFNDLLNDALDQSKTSIEIFVKIYQIINNISGVRRRKSSLDKSQDEEDDGGNKQRVQDLSVSSIISPTPETNDEINTVEKPSVSLRKPIAFSQNGSTTLSGDEQVLKKKRGRKPKTETNNNNSIVKFSFLKYKRNKNCLDFNNNN